MHLTRPLQLLAVVLCAFVYAGCSSKEKASEAPPTPAAEPEKAAEAPSEPAAEAPAEAPASNIVVLTGSDQMQYNTKEIRVKSGGETTVNLTHTGSLPVESMGHNFVLLKQGVDMNAFAAKANAATQSGYIPEGDDIIAYTQVVGGGESTSVTFETPEPGTYQFLCTFPGHYALMNGTFVVEG
ncbi:MAG: azurin [Myxococcota bacterium]